MSADSYYINVYPGREPWWCFRHHTRESAEEFKDQGRIYMIVVRPKFFKSFGGSRWTPLKER